MYRILKISLWLGIVFVAACSEVPKEKVMSNESDVQAIQALFDKVLVLASAGDADSLLELYTNDAIWMLPDRWQDSKKKEASSFYQEFFDWATLDRENYRIQLDEVIVAGEWAFVRHTDQGELITKDDGKRIQQGSRHISILHRQSDGSWKIARDIFNNPPLDSE